MNMNSVIRLQCMNVFWPKCMHFWYCLHVFAFYHEKVLSKHNKKIFFYQKYAHLGENNFIYFSRITVVHIRAIFFSKNHHSCHSVTKTESNEEVTKND